MGTTFLYIPWFKIGEWPVPLHWAVAVVVGLCALAALKAAWRPQAASTATLALVAGVAAYFAGFETVPVQGFGVLVALGVILGTRLAEWQGKQWGIHPAYIADFTTHVVVIGLVSCYILNGVFYETDTLLEILADPSLIFSRWLGLSSFGGFIGAAFGVWVWKKRRGGLPVLHLADCMGFAFPLGWIFGRLGCFVVHDHPGRETDFFLGVENYYESGVVRHDLGLYEVFYAIFAMALHWSLRNMKNRPTGLFVALLPLPYVPVRFGLDFLRAEDLSSSDVRYWGLTPAQYAAIGFFFFAIFFLRYVMKRGPIPVPAKLRWPPVDEEEEKAKDEDEAPKKRRKKKRSTKKKKPAPETKSTSDESADASDDGEDGDTGDAGEDDAPPPKKKSKRRKKKKG